MSSQSYAAFVVAIGMGVMLLLSLPILIATARDIEGKADIVLLAVLLGWTGVAWACALMLALSRPSRHDRPSAPAPAGPRPTTWNDERDAYEEGSYLVSVGPESHTWAVHVCGEWRIVYEVAGVERLVGAVTESDVPISVLAAALRPVEA